MGQVKDKFRNSTEGHIGVTTIDARGERHAIAVPPGDDVWLSEEEQAITANAPRNPDDNPLANGQLVLVAEGESIVNARPLRPVRATAVEETAEPVVEPDVEETGAAPAPAGEPEEGSRPATEEVGTPEAITREEAVRENVAAAAHTAPKPRRAKAVA